MPTDGFWGQKSKSGFGISILEMLCVPIFRQKKQIWIFEPKFANKWILESKFKNVSLDVESASLKYYVYLFSDKTNEFEFLGPNLPTNEFWGHSFKNLTLDLESASLRYSVHQFSDKTENFEYLDPNLPKNGFWGLNFKVWIRNQHLWDTMCTNFQTKWTTLTFWAHIC